MKEYLVKHAPYYHRFNLERLSDRVIDELIGVCKGCIIDQDLSDVEIKFLESWIKQNSEFIDLYPINILYKRIKEILLDGIIDEKERTQLFSLLSELSGFTPDSFKLNVSSSLPLDDPKPVITIPNNCFCFTGIFAFGSRERCETETIIREGIINKSVTLKTDYLVIGSMSSIDWAHSSYGRKIEKAMSLKQAKKKPWIVSEEHWTNHISL